jgi:hypothetical protein
MIKRVLYTCEAECKNSFDVGDRFLLTPRFSEVTGVLRAWGTVSTVYPAGALETVETV